MHASTDEVGGSLSQIGFHPAEIEQHGLLVSNSQNGLERFIEALGGEHDYVVPSVLERGIHRAMMVGFSAVGMFIVAALAAFVLIGVAPACSMAGSKGEAEPKQAMFMTREEAEVAAPEFGCKGAHKMGDMWMVCEQHGDAQTDHGQH